MSRFVGNPNLAAELELQVRPALRVVGEAVADQVTALTHHAMPRKGHARIEVTDTAEGVEVANTNYGAAIEEFGSRNSPPYAPLRRGARAAGLKLHES